jgi:copper chaperone
MKLGQKEMLMRFHIDNMTCGGCARNVTKALEGVDPRARVDADPGTRKVTIESALPAEAFSRALDDAGYPASAA